MAPIGSVSQLVVLVKSVAAMSRSGTARNGDVGCCRGKVCCRCVALCFGEVMYAKFPFRQSRVLYCFGVLGEGDGRMWLSAVAFSIGAVKHHLDT